MTNRRLVAVMVGSALLVAAVSASSSALRGTATPLATATTVTPPPTGAPLPNPLSPPGPHASVPSSSGSSPSPGATLQASPFPMSTTGTWGGWSSCQQGWELSQAVIPDGESLASTNLDGVAVVSPSDVWVVGSTALQGGGPEPLAEHWDGGSWSIAPVPVPAAAGALGGAQLDAVAAVSSGDVWAVGQVGVSSWSTSDGGQQWSSADTLIEHWEGTAWSVVPSPDAASRDGVSPVDSLVSLVAISSDDVWAAGVTQWPLSVGLSFVAQPLVEHWDGSSWSLVNVPDPVAPPPDWALGDARPPTGAAPVGSAVLLGGAASSGDDVWLVGGYQEDSGITTPPGPWETLTEHWDGSSWSVVPAPDVTLPEPLEDGSPHADDALTAAGVSPAGDLWAVGGAMPGSALTLQWAAGSWTLVPSVALSVTRVAPQAPGGGGYGLPDTTGLQPPSGAGTGVPALAAALSFGGDDVWAVGAAILQWDGSSWQATYSVDGQGLGYLEALGASDSGDLWAVGGATMLRMCS